MGVDQFQDVHFLKIEIFGSGGREQFREESFSDDSTEDIGVPNELMDLLLGMSHGTPHNTLGT